MRRCMPNLIRSVARPAAPGCSFLVCYDSRRSSYRVSARARPRGRGRAERREAPGAEGRSAGQAAAVPVRDDPQQDPRGPRARRRRHQPGRGRSGPADAGARDPGAPAGGRGPGEPPVYPTDEEKGMLRFRQSVAGWYKERFKVNLDPEKEVLALIGSKEGNHHLCLATLNPGDTAILPDPGYPAYFASAVFAGRRGRAHPALPRGRVPAALRQDLRRSCRSGRSCCSSATRTIRRCGRAALVLAGGGRLGEAVRRDPGERPPVQRGHVRRLPLGQHPRSRGRDGRGGRVQLALEAVQHDRLADRHGGRQPRADRRRSRRSRRTPTRASSTRSSTPPSRRSKGRSRAAAT